MHLSLMLALLQQPAAPAQAPFPIAKVVVTPATAEIQVGQTIRLTGQALDSAGKQVPGSKVAWFAGGTEGSVDSTGLVTGGYSGHVRVYAVGLVLGQNGQKMTEVVITVLPEPPARVAVTPAPAKLVVGTHLTLLGTAYSKHDDVRHDPVTFASSNLRVAAVTPDGAVHAVAPGRANVTATAGPATATLAIQVVANTIAKLAVEPAATSVRTGDGVRFAAQAKDAAGKPVRDVAVQWSLAAGSGVAEIDPQGAFVGEGPRSYTGTPAGGRRPPGPEERHRRLRRERRVPPQADRRIHGDRLGWGAQLLRLPGPRLHHRRRHRLDAGDRHPRPLPPEGSRTLAGRADRGRPLSPRHHGEGRARLPRLLERRADHPRRGQRDEGRQPGEPAARVAIQVRSERHVRACGAALGPRIRTGDAHRLARREIRVRRGRGLRRPALQGAGGRQQPHLRPHARDRRVGHRAPYGGRLVRADRRRRPQRLGRGRYALPRQLPGRGARARRVRRAERRPTAAGPRDQLDSHGRLDRAPAAHAVRLGGGGPPSARTSVHRRSASRSAARVVAPRSGWAGRRPWGASGRGRWP